MEKEENGPQKGGLAVAEEALVDHVAELTATPRDLVLRSLLARTVASGGRELIEKGHTVAEASYARDACAKVLPGCLEGGNPGGLYRRCQAGSSKNWHALSPGGLPAAV